MNYTMQQRGAPMVPDRDNMRRIRLLPPTGRVVTRKADPGGIILRKCIDSDEQEPLARPSDSAALTMRAAVQPPNMPLLAS